MTLLTKEERTKKNKLIGRANKLGWKIEFWGFVEQFAKEIKDYSTAEISKCQNKQDELLDEIEGIRRKGIELLEVVKEN